MYKISELIENFERKRATKKYITALQARMELDISSPPDFVAEIITPIEHKIKRRLYEKHTTDMLKSAKVLNKYIQSPKAEEMNFEDILKGF